MITEREKQIIEAGKAAGKTPAEIKAAIIKYRSINPPQLMKGGVPAPTPQTSFKEDVKGDFTKIGTDAVKQFDEAGKNIVDIATGPETTMTDRANKVLGIGAEAFKRGGRFIASSLEGLGKMVIPEALEQKLEGAARATGEDIVKYTKDFLEKNKNDEGVQQIQSLVDKYQNDTEFKKQVDIAGGFAEGASEILGSTAATKTLGKVRALPPELDVPYFQEAEKSIAEGIANMKASRFGNTDELMDTALKTGQEIAQKYRDLSEGMTDRVIQMYDRQALKDNASIPIEQVDANVADMYINAVSPGVKGKKQSVSGLQENTKAAVAAVKDITENKETMRFRDIETNEVIEGALPSNLWEFGGAITHQKSEVYKKVLEKIEQTGDAPVNLDRVSTALDEILENPIYQNETAILNRAKQANDKYSLNEYTPAQLEDLIKLENDRLQAFYRGNGTQADAIVSAIIANHLRDILDETVEAATGEGVKELKRRYGNLKEVERDVVHRALHNQQARKAGMVDMFNIRSIGDVASAAGGNPAGLARGAAEMAGASFIKALNDRDALIKRMFLVADERYGKSNASAGVSENMTETIK